MSDIKKDDGTPFKNFILFALPRTAASMVLTVIDFAIIFLYVEGYGKDYKPLEWLGIPLYFAFFVGIATACGKLSIAASQFSMGYLSDSTRSKKLGKRKPFMIISAPILAIAFTFLLLPTFFLGSRPDFITLFLWLLIFDMIFQFFYGSLTTPYQSWMAEQFEVHERTTAAAWQNIFNYVGTGLAVLFTVIIIPQTMADFSNTRAIGPIYTVIAIIFAIIVISLFYTTALLLPVEKEPPIKINLKKDMKELWKDKNYIHVCMLIGIASLTWSMITGLMLGYFQVVLKLDNMLVSAGGLIIGVLGSLFIWKKVIDTIGKKKALTIIFIWAIVTIPFAGILPLIPFEDFTVPALLLMIIVAASLGGWFLFPYILYADLAENEERTGEEAEMKAGLYTGFPSILLNLFQAFGLFLVGLILSTPTVPGEDYSMGYLLWAPIGSVILVVALLYLRKYITLDFEWEAERK
ncbi:MAG: MFS transporter [Promethearchaeota archaeon]|nr:MAG: MFS transporter [Candidatus Lokiarchaeota archaeon]